MPLDGTTNVGSGGEEEDHAPEHEDGGEDELPVENLPTSGAADTVPTSDGAGGVSMQSPPAGNAAQWLAEVVDSKKTNQGTDGGLFDGGDVERWVEVPASADYSTLWKGAVLPGLLEETFEFDAIVQSVNNTYSRGLIGLNDGTTGFGDDILFHTASSATDERVRNAAAGTNTNTKNLGRDWTVEHTFRAEWSASQVDFYEDGTLLASHTTNIPTLRLTPCAEAATDAATAPASACRTTVREVRRL